MFKFIATGVMFFIVLILLAFYRIPKCGTCGGTLGEKVGCDECYEFWLGQQW